MFFIYYHLNFTILYIENYFQIEKNKTTQLCYKDVLLIAHN